MHWLLRSALDLLGSTRSCYLKLGLPEDEPEFSRLQWFAMLFCCGVAVGLWFYGVAEPLWHYNTH